MKLQKLDKSYTNNIELFKEALAGAKANLLTAGKLLVGMLKENDDTFEILLSECKGVTLAFLESLERVGRGQLDPLLLTDPSPAAQRAVSQALPKNQQDQLLNGMVPVAVRDNGGVKIEQRRMTEISAVEACRVIGDGKIRSADEQIEIIKQEVAARAARQVRYEIRGDKVVFRDHTPWDYKSLSEIADKIAPKATDIEASIKRNQLVR